MTIFTLPPPPLSVVPAWHWVQTLSPGAPVSLGSAPSTSANRAPVNKSVAIIMYVRCISLFPDRVSCLLRGDGYVRGHVPGLNAEYVGSRNGSELHVDPEQPGHVAVVGDDAAGRASSGEGGHLRLGGGHVQPGHIRDPKRDRLPLQASAPCAHDAVEDRDIGRNIGCDGVPIRDVDPRPR